MLLSVGMGSIDEYIEYVKAGADEVFCGYVPSFWTEKYGISMPLNRREVLYYNVQIGSESELMILKDMVDHYHVPVSITFNSLYYIAEQYPVIAGIMEHCAELGFSSFIIADPGLLFYLNQHGYASSYHISISGEISEMNLSFAQLMCDYPIDRIIYHRKMSLWQMDQMIRKLKEESETCQEYEAFFLNEMCHFHGGFCHSYHCDELCHMCHLPYRLIIDSTPQDFSDASEISLHHLQKVDDTTQETVQDIYADDNDYLPGASGCALCALWELKEMGMTHLKIVGRGNYIDDTIKDIRHAKRALKILEQCKSKEEYVYRMKHALFEHSKCSGKCYYL